MTVTVQQQTVVQAITAHHEELQQAVAAAALAVRDCADRLGDVQPLRDALVLLMLEEVLPHAVAEEATLYRTGAQLPQTELLVAAMVDEHRRLEAMVNELARARTATGAASWAVAVRALFEAHLAKENDLLIPALVAADVDLAQLLDGMHEVLGHPAETSSGGCGCGGCGCGGHGAAGGETKGEATSEGLTQASESDAQPGDLDVRSLPPALRHEQIFAAVDGLAAGTSFVLCNDHDPLPLRYQLDAQQPGEITWTYLAEGPLVWRVEIGRVAAA